MIRAKLDLLKIQGAKTVTAKDGIEYLAIPINSNLYQGKKSLSLDLTLMTNRDGRDQYDNDGFIIHDLGKDRRQAGEKGPILGNWKDLDGGNPQAGRDVPAIEAMRKPASQHQQAKQNAYVADDDGDLDAIPF